MSIRSVGGVSLDFESSSNISILDNTFRLEFSHQNPSRFTCFSSNPGTRLAIILLLRRSILCIYFEVLFVIMHYDYELRVTGYGVRMKALGCAISASKERLFQAFYFMSNMKSTLPQDD